MKSFKKTGGRPAVVNEVVLQKLEEAFKIDLSIEEACLYAGISERTYYKYAKEDVGFSQRMSRARNFVKVRLHSIVWQAVQNGDARLAWDILQRIESNKYGKNAAPSEIWEEFGVTEGKFREWIA